MALKKGDKVQRFLDIGEVIADDAEIKEVKVDGNVIERLRFPAIQIMWNGNRGHVTEHKNDADLEEHLSQLKIAKVG